MVACGDSERKYDRSKEQAARLSMLNDSIGYANSNFLKACDSMIAIAQDSLDYYELLLAKGGVYTVINPAGSTMPTLPLPSLTDVKTRDNESMVLQAKPTH